MVESLTYHIRPVTPSDEPFLWEMLYQAIFIPAGCDPLPRDVIYDVALRKYVADWGRVDDLGFIALCSDEPIGAAWTRLLSGENKGYGWVDDSTPEITIALVPEWRGRSIGTALMNRLIEATEPRYPALSLSVSPQNPAQSLYHRLGFEIVQQDDNALTMRKRLNG
jgi:ribosomal protein S18 acetylase RimI-like enzyme